MELPVFDLFGPGLLGNQIGEFIFGALCLGVAWVILLVIGLLVLMWLYKDANSRGMNGMLWAILLLTGCFVWLGWLVVLVIYLVVRKDRPGSSPMYAAPAPPPAYAAPPAPPAYAAPAPGYAPPAPPGQAGYAPPPAPQPGYAAPPAPPAPPAQPAPVNCLYCGAQVPPGALVCPRCGGRL